jgi:hypothetical protein
MPPPTHTWPLVCAALLLASAAHAAAPPQRLSFERDVRPVLKAYCLDCHGGGEKLKGGLDLRLRRFALKGGDAGPAVVPGDAKASRLVERMRSGEMPPAGKNVPPELIAVVERWVNSGAYVGRVEPEKLPPGIGLTEEERAYWFFQPLKRPPVPRVAAIDRIRTPVDAFVLEKLEAKRLSFNPDADRLTLLRRATLDLTGLPPTREEIDSFLNDKQPAAYERMIDRLLASPAYGERWGRHWLDVTGYADSDGGLNDATRPDAWRYRDWVVRALNADKPLDRFVVEQLAGDELVPGSWANLKAEQIDLLTATGFLRTAPDAGPAAAEQVVADTLKIVSSSLLGLSVGCAQCHDHRYDPIPQADYFRLRAVFEPALDPSRWRTAAQRRVSLYNDSDRARAAAVEAEAAKMQAAMNVKTQQSVKAAFEKELLKFPAEQRDKLKAAFETPAAKRSPEQQKLVASNPKLNVTPGVLYQYNQAAADELKKMAAQVAAKRAERPPEGFLSVLNEVPGPLPVTKIHYRGDPRQPTKAVTPGDLTIAAPEGKRLEIASKDSKLSTTGRRLAYAKHLTSGEHPLLGRVLANRLWLHHLGRGIVDTPGDFGILGQRPSHTELLDWLATELVREGWSMKAMHRLIMTSTVYRQSARRDADKDRIDTSNALFGRFGLRRLEAETIRDRILATAGRLDRSAGGVPVAVVEDTSGQVNAPDDKPRRSVYLQVRRSKPVALLSTFDAPTTELNCDRRMNSTAAPQALMLMNSDFVRQQATHFARFLRDNTSPDFARSEVTKLLPAFARSSDAWSYGYGEYDSTTRKLSRFAALPHWTGSAWQGGATLPDAKLGWVILHAQGGHAGDDQKRAAVRRWTAPENGKLTVTGKLCHGSPNGDGVRGRIVSTQKGLAGEWLVKNAEKATDVTLDVKKGDVVDFVVDCNKDVNSDSFLWPVKLSLTPTKGSARTWDSAADFAGPSASVPQLVAHAWHQAYQRPASLDELELACTFVDRQTRRLREQGQADPEFKALTNLCQQLLASNELLYLE